MQIAQWLPNLLAIAGNSLNLVRGAPKTTVGINTLLPYDDWFREQFARGIDLVSKVSV